MREVQDHYFKQAKAEGYLSRAAYKLIEIDDRKKILHPGDRVLDCGCAPGSWLQVAAQRVGMRGQVVGIDLLPVKHSFGPNVRVIEGDFTSIAIDELVRAAEPSRPSSEPPRPRGGFVGPFASPPRLFDVILSDMAPNTTGDPSGDHHRSVRLCEALLDRLSLLLRPGGNLVMKVFEGETYPELLRRTQNLFESAKGYKPKASRSESAEMYIVAHTLQQGAAGDLKQADAAAVISRPSRKPSAGWKRPAPG